MTSQQDELHERIRTVLRAALSIDVPTPETDLFDTGLLDSLALVTLLVQLEEDFGYELPLDDFNVEHFRSTKRIGAFSPRPVPSTAA